MFKTNSLHLSFEKKKRKTEQGTQNKALKNKIKK